MKPPSAWAIAVSAAGIAGISFLLQRRIGLNVGDEGFLWYGARQTARGKAPLRDFQSYDPGRYDWCAAIMRLRGDENILTLRLACHAVEIVGLAAGLAVIGRTQPNPLSRSLWGIVCLTWMFPLFRTFETALASTAVLQLTWLLERPTALRHFQTGLSIGTAAYFGRNHGVYQLAAYLTATVTGMPRSRCREKAAGLLAAAGGVVLGYLPMLVRCVTVPGFASALVGGIVAMRRTGRTNLTVDLPWPLRRGARAESLFDVVIGCLFAALPSAYASVMAARALRGTRFVQDNPALFAATCVGIPYLHQAFSRVGHYHLASSIHPFLFTLAAAPRGLRDRRLRGFVDAIGITVSAAFTAVAATRMTPLLIRACSKRPYREVAVGADTLSLSDAGARLIEAMSEVGTLVGPRPRALYVATAPAFYAMLDRESPLHDLYWSLPPGTEHEEFMIAELEANEVAWVMFEDVPLDGLDARRVTHSHEMFWHHIFQNFHRVPVRALPPDVLVLRRDREGDPALSSVVVFNDAGISRHIVTGIFRDGADTAWASGLVHVKLGVPPGAATLHVELFVPAMESTGGQPQRLRCRFPDGTCAESGPLPPGLHEVAFDVPASARQAASVVVRLQPQWTFVPFEAGINADRRTLSVLLARAEIR